MLIMPRNSNDFQALADKIASEFLENGTPLEDGIVKTATKYSMNPEEVRRLVEKSNTSASIKFLSSSDDKKASFQLAKKASVLSKTHPTDGEEDAVSEAIYNDDGSEKTACELPVTREELLEKNALLSIPAAMSLAPSALHPLWASGALGVAGMLYGSKKSRDLMRAANSVAQAQKQKMFNKALQRATLTVGVPVTAAAGTSAINSAMDISDKVESKKSKKDDKSDKKTEKKASEHMTAREIFSVRKDYEAAMQEKVACEILMQSAIDSLVKSYRNKPEAFDKLASDAVAVIGATIQPVVESIGEHLGCVLTFDKCASYIDDTNADLKLLEKVAANITRHQNLLAELDELIAKEAEISEEINNHAVIRF